MKQRNQKVFARWEILSTFESVAEKYGENKNVPASDKQFFKDHFQGNYINLLNENRIDPKQKWTVKIKAKLRLDDGQEGWHEVEFKPDTAMTVNELLKGNSKVKVNQGGIKTRWKGVTLMWIDEMESDLPGSRCLEAWVTAECHTKVRPIQMFNLMQKLVA